MKEKKFSNSHFEYFYTKHFGLDKSFYTDKKILDIGCGPRGSLNWANNASQKVGLDPLASKYLKLGIDSSQMEYVTGYSENIPFENDFFDIVCSFNSLDHVEDIGKTVDEIKRVLKPNGNFLLIIDIHPYKTITEPHKINWEICSEISTKLKLLRKMEFEKKSLKIYTSILHNIPYDHTNIKKRYGILSAIFLKEDFITN